MNRFTLLTDEQTFGSKKIEVIKKLGTRCAISDFAILFDANFDDTFHTDDDNSLKGRVGAWYLMSSNCGGNVRYVTYNGDRDWAIACRRTCSVRPVLPYSNISDITSNVMHRNKGILEAVYGEYPQYAVNSKLNNVLEDEFSKGKLKKTGKVYITDSRKPFELSKKFCPIKHIEYEYNGKKYVRVKSSNLGAKLSNGVNVKQAEIVWVEVSPITWYVDEESKLLISKTLLASGVRFCNNGKYKGNFKKTEMYRFLNKYFANNIKTDKLQMEENPVAKQDGKIKLERLIKEIYEYCENLTNGEVIIKRVDGIVKEYNDKITEIRDLKSGSLITLESLAEINNRLELKLKVIFDDLKRQHEKYKVYFEMLDVINEYISVINGNSVELNHELSKDLSIIANVCIPYLNKEDGDRIKIELLTILNTYKEKINCYLSNVNVFDKGINDDKLEFTTINEMNLDIRKSIQPLLINLYSSVSKKDIELEIQDFVQDTVNGFYSEPKNKYLSFYLTEIKKTYESTVSLMEKLPKELQKKYKEKLTAIMTFNIDYSKDFNSITNSLIEIWLRLNRVFNDIEKYLKEIEELNNSYIDISKVSCLKK